MGDEFEKRAQERDAALAAERTRSTLDEASQARNSESDKQHLLEQHAQVLEQDAKSHQSNLDAIHLDGVSRQQNHIQATQNHIMVRQLGLANTQADVDVDLGETLSDLRTDQAQEGQRYDVAFDNWSDDWKTAQLNHALASHQQLTSETDNRHLQTAAKRAKQAHEDRVNHATTQERRNERWENREQDYLNHHDKGELIHHQQSLDAQGELAENAHQRMQDLGTDLLQADETLREATSEIAHKKASAGLNERERHETSISHNRQDRNDDSLSLEQQRAKGDHFRALHLAEQDEQNDRTLERRSESINAWKEDLLQANHTKDDSSRHERDISRVKNYVNQSERVNVRQTAEQAKRDEAAYESSQKRWEAHSNIQANNDRTYTKQLDNARLDYAHDTLSHREAIVNLEDQYHIRRALHDAQHNPEEKHQRQFGDPQRELKFERERDALNIQFSDEYLSAKSNIRARTHDHELRSAQTELKRDHDSRQQHSDRNAEYAQISTSRETRHQSLADSRRIKNGQDFLDYQQKIASQSHNSMRDAAIDSERMDREAQTSQREKALLRQRHHDEKVFNEQARAIETQLRRVDNTLEDKSAVAKSAHDSEYMHAQHQSIIEQKHRDIEETIHDTYANRRTTIDQSKASLADRSRLSHSDQILAHRSIVRSKDLHNQLQYALADKKLASDEARRANQIAIEADSNDQQLGHWYSKDKDDKRIERNEFGRSLYTRHATEYYEEKVQQALEESKDERNDLISSSNIVREYAHDAYANQKYEIDLHDAAALKLHEMRLAAEKAKAAEAHDTLLATAIELNRQDRDAMNWEAARIEEKANALQQADKIEQSSKDTLAIAKHEESLENHQSAATAVHGTYLKSAKHHIAIDLNLAKKESETIQKIVDKAESLDHQYDRSRDTQRLSSVENDLSLKQTYANQSDNYARADKLTQEQLDARYDSTLSTLTANFAKNLQNRELTYQNGVYNLLMQRHIASADRSRERSERQTRYNDLESTIASNNQKIAQRGMSSNWLIWIGSNYTYWWDQAWINIDNSVDSIKEWFADYGWAVSKWIRGTVYYGGYALEHANYYAKKTSTFVGYEVDSIHNDMNLAASSVGNWLGRITTATKNFLSETFSQLFTNIIYGASFTGNKINEKVSPIIPQATAIANHVNVSGNFYHERFQEEVSQPARTFATALKAGFWSKIYGTISALKGLGNRAIAQIKKMVNGLWTFVSDASLRVRSSISQAGNFIRSSWRSLTHGWGRATRKARRTVVLPAKQGIAQADKSRKTGIAYVMSRPAAWWRSFKHSISRASWEASAATYPAREVVAGLGDDTARNAQYYATAAKNGVVHQSKNFFSKMWYSLRAAFNRSGNVIDNAAVNILDGAHQIQEHTPNPINAAESVILNVQQAAASVDRSVSLTRNDVMTDVQSTAENIFHALKQPIHPVHEAARETATTVVHKKDQTVDVAMNKAQAAGKGIVRAGGSLKHAAKAAKHIFVQGARNVASGMEHATSVAGQVVIQYGVQPLENFCFPISTGFVYVAYATGYYGDRTAQQVREGLGTLLSMPGQAIESAGVAFANLGDEIDPYFNYGLNRPILTIKYYGGVVIDGMTYALEVIVDAAKVPFEMIVDATESATDTIVTSTKEKGHQFAIVYHRGNTALTMLTAGVGHGWTKVTDHISYGVRDTVMAGVANAHEAGANITDAAQQGVLAAKFHSGNLLVGTGDVIVDVGSTAAYYGTASGVNIAALIAQSAVHAAHGVSSVVSDASSGLTQINQARQYHQGKAIHVVYYFGADRNEGRKHALNLLGNAVSYAFSGIWDEAVHTGQTSIAHAKNGVSAVNIPIIHGRIHWNDFIHTMSSIGNFCLFEMVQTGDKAMANVADGAQAVADETYYAFEGCGDAIILSMKGTQVSVVNGTGRYAVKSLIAVGSLGHAMGHLKDEAVNGTVATGHEVIADLKHAAVSAVATVGQMKDDALTPIVQTADEAYTAMLKKFENARYGLVSGSKEGVYQAKSGGLFLMSAGTQAFTGAKHSVEETGRNVAAEVGKTKDDVQKYIRDNYDINYIEDRRPIIEV